MRIKFLGAAGEVTGSSFLLTRTGGGEEVKILVDCGLNQGSHYCELRNFEDFPYNPAEIKAVFVTHAHIDHIGQLPKLYRRGFRGKIYGTAPTRDFAGAMLLDSVDILKREAEREHKDILYDASDVASALSLWTPVEYGEMVKESGFRVVFKNAGHILGSSSIILNADGRTVLFSGDLGNTTSTIIGAKDAIYESIDYCFMESTYGSRVHENEIATKENLENIIEDTVRARGVLMIPAFAMERTQKLLFEIDQLTTEGRIPKMPVFIDSPLAVALTKIYEKYKDHLSVEAEELAAESKQLFNFPGLKFTVTTDESKAINNVPAPKIIIAGSGMSNGGRILHHESRYLSDPKSTIVFIGYQARNTLGRRILDGDKIVKIFGEEVAVKCKVVNIPGYSAHADQKGLLGWLFQMRKTLKKVFLIHGDLDVMEEFRPKIEDELAVPVAIPSINEEIVLD